MRKLLLVVVFVIPCIMNAQENVNPKIIIKFSPISLLNIETPMIQFGGEIFIRHRQSLQYEVGYFSDNFMTAPTNGYQTVNSFTGQMTSSTTYKGFGGRIRIEYRFYRENLYTDKFNWYQGLGMQLKQINQDYDRFYCPAEMQFPCPVTLIEHPVRDIELLTGLFYTIGGQYFFSKKLIVDIGASPGFVFKKNAFINYPSFEEQPEFVGAFEGGSLWINLNFKIGYAF